MLGGNTAICAVNGVAVRLGEMVKDVVGASCNDVGAASTLVAMTDKKNTMAK